MKYFSFVALFFLTTVVNSQTNFAFTKADSLVYSPDSSLVLIYKKKKVGLFETKRNQLVIPMAKQKILPLFGRGLVLVYLEGELKIYNQKGDAFKSPSDFSELDNGFQITNIEGSTFLIHDFEPEPWMTFTYESEMPPLTDQQSGVYNFEQGEWVIENNYEKIIDFNNHLIGARKDSRYSHQQEYGYDDIGSLTEINAHFDVFSKKGNSWQLEIEGLKTNLEVVKAIFGTENVLDSLENLYTVSTKDQVGLINFNLLNYDDKGFQYAIYEWVLKPEFKMIFPSYDQNYIGTLTIDNQIKIFEQTDSTNTYNAVAKSRSSVYAQHSNNQTTAYLIEGKRMVVSEYFEPDNYGFFGLELINDTIVKLLDYEYFAPFPAYTEDGYDSVDMDLNLVYQYPDPTQKSGAFNVNSCKWLIEPKFINLYEARDQGWIVASASEKAENWSGFEEKYSYIGPNESAFRSNLSFTEFFNDIELMYMFVLDTNLTELIPSKFTLNEDSPLMYYAKVGNKMKLVYSDPINSFDPVLQTKPTDFQQRNFYLDYTIYLDNNQWTIESNDTTYSINSLDGWNLYITNPAEIECREIKLKSRNPAEKDSLMLQVKSENKTCEFAGDISVISVDRKDDLMVVNDVNRSKTFLSDSWGEYYEEAFIDIEQSAIWQKSDKGWDRISPVYAEITIVKNGYIARTGLNPGTLVIEGEGWAQFDEYGNVRVNGAKEVRYLYLDNNAKPVSFMDYFDFVQISDLGYGLQFNTDRGAFFVTYEGKAITDDEWDSFELVDGKLKAFSQGLIKDEFGNVRYDEWGEPLYKMSTTTKFFDFK